MPLTPFLHARGFYEFEGYSQQIPSQVDDLAELTKNPNISVLEIGFNAGHSAEVFLRHNSELTLTSFDLGIHDYVHTAKEYIDAIYPDRHELILGDSVLTIPKYTNDNPNKKFDVIFIDGGHEYEIAKADLENCMKLAHGNTLILLDDTMYTQEWMQDYTVGPTRAWLEYINDNKITEIKRVDYCIGRGMSWGKYNI